MSESPNPQDTLRKAAENELIRSPKLDTRPAEEILHELRIHQIELEMQNDELRRAQVVIEEMRDSYVDLYEFAPVGYFTLTREGLISKVNLTGAEMLGVERNKLINRRFAKFIIKEDCNDWYHHFITILKRDGRQQCELTLQRGDGSRIQVNISSLKSNDSLSSKEVDNLLHPHSTPNNSLLLRIVLTDISQIKEAEKVLWEKNQLLDNIVENIPAMIFLKRASDLHFELFNKAGENLLGYSRQDLLGKGNYDLWPKEQGDWFTTADRKALASTTNTEIPEEPIQLANGENRFLHTWKVALRNQKGDPTHLLGISVDITERKRSEQQLRDLTEHLKSVREEEKTHLAREIHDELGSVLAALKMDAYWIAQKLTADKNKSDPLLERAQSMVDLLNNAIKTLRRIITDLRPTLLDDLGLIKALKWQAEQFHKNTNIECQVVCPDSLHDDNLDQFDKKLSINLFRIFQETLTNIARHSGASKVDVKFQPDNKKVELSISDNGRGLPEGQAIASTSNGIRGMRERVEQLGGTIEFNTPSGGGFNVTATIPLLAEPLEKNLATSETYYHSLFENMLDGYVYCKMLYDENNQPVDFIYLNINEAFGQMIGLKDAVEKTDSQVNLSIKTLDPKLFEIYSRVASTGIHEVFDLDLPLRGKSFNVSVYCPEKEHFIAIFCDVTQRKQTEAELRIAAIAFETQEGIIVTDADTVILRVNKAFTKITGYTAEEVIGQKPSLIKSGRHNAAFYATMRKIILKTGAWQGEIWNQRKNGEIFPEYLTITSVKDNNGKITHYVATMSDITKRKLAEQNQNRLSRALKLLSNCDSLLVRSENEQELLTSICKLTVETGGYLMAWVGFAENDAAKSVRTVAQAGHNAGYLDSINITWADTERGRGPVGTAIREGVPVAFHDFQTHPKLAPWCDEARKRGYKSCLALPLFAHNSTLGMLAIYSADLLTFGKEEVELLEDLAKDLSYGIEVLRTRVAHNAAEIALKKESEKNRALLLNSSDGIHILDSEGNLIEASDSFYTMLGYESNELLGINCSKWNAKLSDTELRQQLAEQFKQPFGQQSRSLVETQFRRQEGTIFDVEVSSLLLELDGKPVSFNSARDITLRKATEDQIKNLAYYDPLTKLPNRRLLIDRMGLTIDSHQHNNCYGALLFLDLDNFKPLNDTCGHGVGDLLLIEVARRISYCVRKTDTVARIGGDEFVVILSDLDENKSAAITEALAIAEKIRISLAEPYLITVQQGEQKPYIVEHHCTSSIGMVLFIGQETNIENILKCADSAMYQAKNDGRNLIRLYETQSGESKIESA